MIAAEGREFAGLRRHCRSVRKLRWPIRYAREAELRGRRLILAAHGAGPGLAAEACEVAWARRRAEVMVSTGFCGALDAALEPGDVFAATEVLDPDRNLRFTAQAPKCPLPCREGLLASVNRIVQTREEKALLRATGAEAVEMEAVSVAQRARAWGVPFYCVRSVTDLARESFKLDLNAARSSDGHLSDFRILASALADPLALGPELWLLYRRSRLAARSLGDFLAACEF